MMAPDYAVVVLVVIATVLGLATAAYFASRIALISIEDNGEGANARLINNEHKPAIEDANATMSVSEIAKAISEGANAFLYAEYQVSRTAAQGTTRAQSGTTGTQRGGAIDRCAGSRPHESDVRRRSAGWRWLCARSSPMVCLTIRVLCLRACSSSFSGWVRSWPVSAWSSC